MRRCRSDIPIDSVWRFHLNIAPRLQALAEPGRIRLSASVYDQIVGKLNFACQFLGEQTVKYITRPVRVCGVDPRLAALDLLRDAPGSGARRAALLRVERQSPRPTRQRDGRPRSGRSTSARASPSATSCSAWHACSPAGRASRSSRGDQHGRDAQPYLDPAGSSPAPMGAGPVAVGVAKPGDPSPRRCPRAWPGSPPGRRRPSCPP